MPIPEYKKTILKNGLIILTEHIPAMRSVAMGIVAGVGSGQETNDKAGISHFVEHMAFKGTKKRSAFQIASELDAVGGKMNAYTSKEITNYYAVVLDEHLDIAVDVLCDIYLNSVYDQKEMELEKGVILEEIKMYEDTPDEQIHDLFTEAIYHGHPMGRPTIGDEKTVKSITRPDILEYMKLHYTGDNTIVALAGSVDHDKAVAKIEAHLSSMPAIKDQRTLSVPTLKKSHTLKNKKTEQVHICLGTGGPSQKDDDRYPFSMLDTAVGGKMSSRLFQEIREKRGLAYSIYSYNAALKDSGLFVVYAGTGKENYKQVIDLTIAELNKVKKEGITQEELDRTREHLKGSLVLGLESTSSRMGWLARSQYYYDRIMTIEEIFTRIDKINRNDIIEMANKYIRNEDMSLTLIGDLKESEIPKI